MGRRAHGEGSIYQRASDGLWVAVVQLGRTAGGKRRRRYFTAKTQREALHKRAQFLRDLEEGLTSSKKARAFTVGEWLDYWLEHVVQEECEPTTHDGYVQVVERHIKPHLGGIPLRELETEHVDEWLQGMKTRQVGTRTRQVALARLRTALNVALGRRQQTGLRYNAAAVSSMPPSTTRKVTSINMAHAHALLQAAQGDRLAAILTVTIALGLRRGEAIGLRWEDIDFDKAVVHVRRRVSRVRQKGLIVRQGTKMNPDEAYTIVMPQVAAQALREHKTRQIEERLHVGEAWRGELGPDGKPSGFVFTWPNGAMLEPRQANRYLEDVRARAGLGMKTFHQLRHDCASLLLAQGVPLWAVSQILRHKNPGITARYYAHLSPELHRDAADRMDVALGPLLQDHA